MDKKTAIDTSVLVLKNHYPELTGAGLRAVLDEKPEYLSIRQVADILECTSQNIYAKINKTIPAVQNGAGKWRIAKNDVLLYRDGVIA